MNPIPTAQFSAELSFHFREHSAERRHWFMFGDDLQRRVPMRMDGVEGLNTIIMWVEKPGIFHTGDTVKVKCRVIAPELFDAIINPAVRFELWDAGFFAEGIVLERIEAGWQNAL